jgi:hypothetical protein
MSKAYRRGLSDGNCSETLKNFEWPFFSTRPRRGSPTVDPEMLAAAPRPVRKKLRSLRPLPSVIERRPAAGARRLGVVTRLTEKPDATRIAHGGLVAALGVGERRIVVEM